MQALQKFISSHLWVFSSRMLFAPAHLDRQEDRMQTVADIVRSVQELMDELKITATTPLDNRILGSLAIPSPEGPPVLQTTEVTRD